MANPRDHIPSTDPTEDGDWFDRLSDEQKDTALEHMLERIAARNSKLLDPQNDNNLIAEIARSGAPNAANIFLRHVQKRNGPDFVHALRKCIAQRPRAPVGPLIHAAHKCGANLESWVLDVPPEQREALKGDAPDARIAANAPATDNLTPAQCHNTTSAVSNKQSRNNRRKVFRS